MAKVAGFTIEPMEGDSGPDIHYLFPRTMEFGVDMQQIGEDTLRTTWWYRIRYWPRWKELNEVGKIEKPLEKLPCGCSGDRECTEAVHLWNDVKAAYEGYWGWRNSLSGKDRDAEEASRWRAYLDSLAAYRRHKESQGNGA